MKQKDIQELKAKPKEELVTLLREQRVKLHGLKTQIAAGKVKNVREAHTVRKQVARILTFLHQHGKNK